MPFVGRYYHAECDEGAGEDGRRYFFFSGGEAVGREEENGRRETWLGWVGLGCAEGGGLEVEGRLVGLEGRKGTVRCVKG